MGSIKHGESRRTVEYWAWARMKKRCYDPNYEHYERYGGRGITVCDEWINDYSAFLREVGRRPDPSYSLNRIKNDEGYKPGNVKWSNSKEQANNRSNSRFYTFNGEALTIAEWADKLDIPYKRLYKRLVTFGYPVEKALTTNVYDTHGELVG